MSRSESLEEKLIAVVHCAIFCVFGNARDVIRVTKTQMLFVFEEKLIAVVDCAIFCVFGNVRDVIRLTKTQIVFLSFFPILMFRRTKVAVEDRKYDPGGEGALHPQLPLAASGPFPKSPEPMLQVSNMTLDMCQYHR